LRARPGYVVRMESEERDTERDDAQTETTEEFVEEMENDPARNPDDPDLERVQGG
jgi:hypothetical protein